MAKQARPHATAAETGDLFGNGELSYAASDIEVLEGLEPVRRRPAMFIGGTDERALHHLAAEILDNAMDEVAAGVANRIEVALAADGTLSIRDNGRGIPVEPHPQVKGKSALEVILTRLHAGAKFSTKAYRIAGGLHGVGLSVVNALSETLVIEVARDRTLWRQHYRRGLPSGPPQNLGAVANRRGTAVCFRPDPQIFGADAAFRAGTVYNLARAKAYLVRGVEIRWSCDPAAAALDQVPASETILFPGGLADYLKALLTGRPLLTPQPFVGQAPLPQAEGRIEWALAWPADGEGLTASYCNTIPTPQGGTHEAGFRAAICKGLKAYGVITRNRDIEKVTADDAFAGASVLISLFLPQPSFQGQTKERLTSPEAARLVESAVRDHFDHWLAEAPEAAGGLLGALIERADERLRRQDARRSRRPSANRRLRLPGKLADCGLDQAAGTELFVVEGDSAGGSAKQARNRAFQAVLPLRGKILNVASASADRLQANRELNDLMEALGCGAGPRFDPARLRYERIILMTDADVDGAHIASLLLTFFFREMPQLLERGHVYLAVPPLYRLSRGPISHYARDDAHKEELLRSVFAGRADVDVSRFKGLGEMPADQLRTTTMDPASRTLLRVVLDDATASRPRPDPSTLIEALMGRRPERRFAFIMERAPFIRDLDI